MIYSLRRQVTPASSECTQSWTPMPLLGQSISLVSVPVHLTLSSRILPVPWPKKALTLAVEPWNGVYKLYWFMVTSMYIPYTFFGVAELSTHDLGIYTAPPIITNSTPHTTTTYFHTTLKIVATSHQSYISSGTTTYENKSVASKVNATYTVDHIHICMHTSTSSYIKVCVVNLIILTGCDK